MAGFQSWLPLRMYPDSSVPVVVEISGSFSMNWPNAGQWTLDGGLSTLSTGFLSEDAGCLSSPSSHPGLSSVLESEVPARFYLSAKACQGILRRAEKRGRKLPERLQSALSAVATDLTPTERS